MISLSYISISLILLCCSSTILDNNDGRETMSYDGYEVRRSCYIRHRAPDLPTPGNVTAKKHFLHGVNG